MEIKYPSTLDYAVSEYIYGYEGLHLQEGHTLWK